MKNGSVILAGHRFTKQQSPTIDELFDQLERDIWWTLVMAVSTGILVAIVATWLSWPPASCFAFAESYEVSPIGCFGPTAFAALATGMTTFVFTYLKVADYFEERARNNDNGRQ